MFSVQSSEFCVRCSLPALTLAYQTGRAVRQGCSVFSVRCSVFSVQSSEFSVQCSEFSVQCSVLCSVFPACLDGHSRQAKDTKQINKNNSIDWFIQNINTIALVEGI